MPADERSDRTRRPGGGDGTAGSRTGAAGDDPDAASAMGEDDLEDDAPLDAAEAAAGAEAAATDVDETLDERIGTVIDALDGVARTREGEVERLSVAGRVFAVIGADLLEVALEPAIAKAALATPDTRPSPRGAGWIAFTPAATDRFALDRAEAWVRLAHRRAGGRTAGSGA